MEGEQTWLLLDRSALGLSLQSDCYFLQLANLINYDYYYCAVYIFLKVTPDFSTECSWLLHTFLT